MTARTSPGARSQGAPDQPAPEDAPDGLGGRPTASRFEAFRELAHARARGEMVFLPRQLTGHERRRHVRQTIREDHETRIVGREQEAVAKFDKLYGSVFSFFRGTCLLFYRDMAGEDAWMPTVLTLGDVHPENFGVMPSVDNVPIFGPNDFDESFYAPFTWDLKRGATAFMIGAGAEGGKGRRGQRKIAACFVRGYVEAMQRFAADSSEQDEQMRQDNAPPLIRHLIEDSLEERSQWLTRKYHDEYGWGFRADDEHVPVTHRVPEFQEALLCLVRDHDVEVPERAGALRVKDVCQRLGQGTASLGLPRYYLKVEGPRQDGSDDLIIEFKHARRSALEGLTPPSDFVVDGDAGRISHAQAVLLVGGDRFYGAVEVDGLSFMVRERAPFRDDIDLDDLSGKQWRTYARICGQSLAQAHALSDEAGLVDHDIEPDILAAVGSHELFVDDIICFADEAAERVRADHQHFRADHEMGAFRAVDQIFR
ncbi:MAG: DUF2252 domain-containing protein [Actinomycetota bacterium]|nr:DUF2252 domain-containing protein [Actinomycetota bacterium]